MVSDTQQKRTVDNLALVSHSGEALKGNPSSRLNYSVDICPEVGLLDCAVTLFFVL